MPAEDAWFEIEETSFSRLKRFLLSSLAIWLLLRALFRSPTDAA